MTDEELVERLLDWPYQGETMAQEAADRIKQLTAERDRAEDELYELQQTCITLRGENEALTAERDRLREALEETAQILSQCTFETIRVHGQYIDRREAVSRALAALKGETP